MFVTNLTALAICRGCLIGDRKMNSRQIKKHLKKQIDILQSDNELMRKIIVDSPKMQELYDVYTKPLHNVSYTTMKFKEYRLKKFLPVDRMNDVTIIDFLKQEIVNDLIYEVRNHITFKLDTECMPQTLSASIFIGIKEEGDQTV
jgi:hypothetical protein